MSVKCTIEEEKPSTVIINKINAILKGYITGSEINYPAQRYLFM